MQAKARDGGAAWTGEGVHALRIDLIPYSRDTAPRIRAESNLARYGGGIESRQPWLIAREGIRLFRIAVGSQTTTLEQCGNSFHQRPGQSRDFFIVWRKQYLKLRMAVLIGGVDAVDHQHMQV